MVKWDRGWHGQENRWIDVKEAIELRDSGTLKTGDLFCCRCENTRLSPVDSVERVKHLRKHPKHRKEAKRVPCDKIRKAREKGESWKYSRVVDAIVHYLESDAKDTLKIKTVELGTTKEEPDIIVTHSEILKGFESEKSYLIVPFQNLRRSRKLFNRYAPNSVAVEIHRYRDKDVDYIQYIRERVDKAYEIGLESSLSPEFLHSSTNIPNMGVWSGKSGGLGRALTLKVDADIDVKSDEYDMLETIEEMIDVVEEHNLWAISTPGMHRYHLKNLKFKEFSSMGNHHPDPSIDAIISQFDFSKKASGNKAKKSEDDWYNRAIEGDEESLLEGAQELEERVLQVKEDIIQVQIEKGMDPDLARKIADEALENEPSEEEKLREQIEYERSVRDRKQKLQEEFADELKRDHLKRLEDLFREKKAIYDQETGIVKVMCEHGEVILPSITDHSTPQTIVKHFFHHHLFTAAPEIQFWDHIGEDEKKELMKTVRRIYRKHTIFRGVPFRVDLLTDLAVDEVPKILTDTTGITEAVEKIQDRDEGEFKPISRGDLVRLKYFLWADRDYSFPDGRHHSFAELIRKTNHSTDEITKKVVLNLPQPIENLLSGEEGAAEQIIDLLSDALVNSQDSEE